MVFNDAELQEFWKWIAALDSGKYQQAQNQLQAENSYCCLGVGCIVTISADKLKCSAIAPGIEWLDGAMPCDQPNAPDWLKNIDSIFVKKTGMSLTVLNDVGIRRPRYYDSSIHPWWNSEELDRFTFTEIATLLELVFIHKILD